MKKTTKNIMLAGVLVCLFATTMSLAQNDPNAPADFDVGDSTTFNASLYPPQSHEAIAGNITAINMHAVGQTKAWQGYYGNITATITLDDAAGNTFYNWSATEPRGQVYATLGTSIAWADVECYDFSADGVTAANWETIESYYGIATDDADGVNETYTTTDHPTFFVLSQNLTAQCPTSYVFQSGAPQTDNFVNVLLYDPNDIATGWIYTTLIEDKDAGSSSGRTCFNGQECDFQLLVNEDGHGTNVATTTYYFWVELA